MEPTDLKTFELRYELLCRDVVPKDKVELRRAQLRGVLAKDYKPSKSPFEFAEDIAEIKISITELMTVLEDSDLVLDKLSQRRITSRLAHLENRLFLLKANDADEEKIKAEVESDFCMLQGLLFYKEHSSALDDVMEVQTGGGPATSTPVGHRPPSSDGSSASLLSCPSPRFSVNSGPDQQCVQNSNAFVNPMSNNYKAVPVFKWNVKFSGQTQQEGLLSFLEKVEELCVARNISHQELFNSAIDLFTGQALLWFRNIRPKISSWEELVECLRKDFLPVDYEYDIKMEILNRTQGLDENVIMYIMSVESLFRRLGGHISENEILRQVMRNLNPFFADRISAYEIDTLEDLREKCRKIQEVKLRNEKYKPPPSRKSGLLEPEMACVSLRENNSHDQSSVSSLLPSRPGLACWNCDSEGHVFSKCRAPRQRFCYGCGKKNVLKPDCPDCGPKSKNPHAGVAPRD